MFLETGFHRPYNLRDTHSFSIINWLLLVEIRWKNVGNSFSLQNILNFPLGRLRKNLEIDNCPKTVDLPNLN